jgi:predicted MFS family arabinose efflux permease
MAFSTCIFFYLQNYLKGSGYNEAAIGLIYGISSLAAALIAPQVLRIDKRIKERGILVMIPLITAGCFWRVALSRYHYIFFILLSVTEGIIYVAVSDYINKMIPSINRATILSFDSMVFSFFMILAFPLVGMLGDRYSLSFAIGCLAIVAMAFVLINSIVLLKPGRKSRG